MTEIKRQELLCSVAQTLDVIGEMWMVLIIRDLMIFGGARRFEQLREGLGISRNILTDRLRRLVEHELVKKVPIEPGARRMEYKLSRKGWELMPMFLAMYQWCDRWLENPQAKALVFIDSENQRPIAPVQVLSDDGRQLGPGDMQVLPNNAEAEKYLHALGIATAKIKKAAE